MRNQKRLHLWLRRLGQLSLAVALLCAMALSARADGQAEIPQPVIPKPVVTVQGNLVVDNGKPTGFYELALCVRSGRTIVETASNSEVTEADYAADIAATPDHATDGTYTITYYPFRTVAGTVNINTDVLTPVSWNLSEVIYGTWDKTSGQYTDGALNTASTARGIDLTATLDPDLYPDVDPDIVKSYITDVTSADLNAATPVSVRLEAAGDPQMTNVTAQADHYTADPVNPENNSALVTLSAATTDNKSVIFKTDTPVVVVRFAYDLNRFSGLTTVNTAVTGGGYNSITGDTTDPGFWLGGDANDRAAYGADKIPLTWLAKSDAANVANPYADADQQAAATRNHQVVWYSAQCGDKAELDKETTQFYYYLGANGNQQSGSGPVDILVETPTDPFATKKVTLPRTTGYKVLTADPNGLDPAGEGYTYFQNLLKFNDGSLKLKLVNAPTFRKPAGKGGTMVLFYDWDNTLIGSLIVGKGDVRAEVEKYVEDNFVHPDLRPGSTFMDDGAGNTDLSKLTSLARDYTYRGKYAYTVGGNDATLGVADGKEYPLTNKLDYVFTKRVNTTLTQTEVSGDTVSYVHPYALDDPELDPATRDNDAAEYPYVYGWAVVEDTSAFNGNKSASGTQGPWKVMHDAAKVEDVWTTLGTGELTNIKRSVMTGALSTVGTVDPAAVRTAPAFLADADSAWTDGTLGDDYAYSLSGQNSYLRFADFSDITAELDRYNNKDTLVVKAVYEEGEDLRNGALYTIITDPAYTKWNNPEAAKGGAYRVQLTVERSFEVGGVVQGTTRIRMPVVQQDTTIDYKWLSDPEKGINNDLTNTTYDVSNDRDETIYTQVDTDNGEEITFSLALSPRQNRVDYVLIERYGANFVVGTQRSSTNNSQKGDPRKFIPDNYNYLAGADSDTFDDLYDCDFATKEGSEGFVLRGTIGYFLEQATKYNRGEIDQSAYNNSVTFSVAKDANFRMTSGGTDPGPANNTTLRDAFIAAAKKCEAHKNDPAYDCWDPNLDCAKLTYHQAQWFLLDYQANPGADIMTASAAEGQKLSFCHYHVSCSGGHIPSPPTGWASLMDLLKTYNTSAPGSDDRKNADADLGALDVTGLEGMTYLRADANGGRFSDLSSFLTALKKAEADVRGAGMTVNWPNLQYAILHGAAGTNESDMRDEAQEKYWWYDGSAVAPSVTTFAQLLAAAESTYTSVTLKDGDNTFLPKSALKAAAFPDAAKDYLTEANPTRVQRNAWNTLTDNLIPSPTSQGHRRTLIDPDPNVTGDESYEYTYDKYADFDTFMADFEAAYDALRAPTPPASEGAWWEALQTALQPPGDNLGDYDGDGSTKFWWKGGSTPFRVMNFSTLIECVRRLNASDTSTEEYKTAQAEWNRLTVADIESTAISQGLKWKGSDADHPMYPYSGAQLGGNESTQKFLILTQLRQAVSAFDTAAAADPMIILSWDNIQYILLNPGTTPTYSAVTIQKDYYWWKNGGKDGTTVTLTSGAKRGILDANVRNLIQATYRAAFNDPGVTQSLTDLADAAGGSFWDYTRLAKSYTAGTKFPGVGNGNDNDPYDGPDELADLTGYAYTAAQLQDLMSDMAAFRDAAKAAQGISTASDNYDMPDVNWQQVQYYLLNSKTYLPTSDQAIKDLRDQDKAQYGDYWWYYLDERVEPDPPKPDVPDPPPNPATGFLTDFQDVVDGSVTPDDFAANLTTDMLAGWGIVGLDGEAIGDDGLAAIQDCIVNADLVGELDANGVSLADLTWPRIQVLLSVCARDWYWYITADDAEALDYLVNGEGAMLVADGGYIPDEYGQIYPDIFGLAYSLRPAEMDSLEVEDAAELPADLPQDEPSADDPAADADDPVGAGSKPAREETLDDLLAQKAELERQLAQLEERIAAMEEEVGAGSKPARDETTPETPAEPEDPVAPSEPVTPAEPEAPETPETPEETIPATPEEATPETPVIPEPDYAERSEIPLGDEVAGLTWTRSALPAADRLLPGRLYALVPKRLPRLYIV